MRLPFTTATQYAGTSDPSLFCFPTSSSATPASTATETPHGQDSASVELEDVGLSARAGAGAGAGVGGSEVGKAEQEGSGDADGDKVFDYIICGGGTAGCVLASRLSEDPSVKVLLVEAGESDQKELMSRIPAGMGNLFKTHLDWDYTTVPQPALNNRELFQPRGKMLGGCSAMNAQIYQRCAPGDYDDWAANGAPGWAWRDLKPFFDKAEGFVPNPEYKIDEAKRNTKGPYVTGYPSATSVVSKAFVETGPAVGLPKNPDLNVETDAAGITRFQTSATSSGVRSSTSAAYLPPSVFQSRPNLKILTGTLCTRVLFADGNAKDGKGDVKAVGVEVALTNPPNETDKAKRWVARLHPSRGGEVVVSLGAFGSPQLLLCSGIGRPATLAKGGVDKVVVEREGVGEGLKDHVLVSVAFEVRRGESFEWMKSPAKSLPSLLRWLALGTGPLCSNIAEAAGFFWVEDVQQDGSVKILSGPTKEGKRSGPDGEVICAPVYYVHHARAIPPTDTSTQDFWTMCAVVLKPHSTGSVTIRSPDAREKAVIDPAYFEDKRDEEVILKTLHLIRLLSQSAPLKDHLLSVASPRRSFDDWATMSDEELRAHAREVAETIYHPFSTCKMGRRDDPSAVTDPATLKVYGCANVRVCDASVFPIPVGGHPCAPVVAVAEKFADMLKRERDEAKGGA